MCALWYSNSSLILVTKTLCSSAHAYSVVPTFCCPIICSLPGSSVHEISQARILKCLAISYSGGIFLTQGLNLCLLHWQILYHWTTWETCSCAQFSSVQFTCSVRSDSLWLHGLQHARPPCQSPMAGVYANPCPLSQWCHPTISCSVVPFSSCPQSFPVFSNESAPHIWWPKYWSFSFNISPSNEHLGLISIGMDWLDLLAVQGTLKSLQHHSSKASFLWCSAFFIVQLWHPYIPTGKKHSLD